MQGSHTFCSPRPLLDPRCLPLVAHSYLPLLSATIDCWSPPVITWCCQQWFIATHCTCHLHDHFANPYFFDDFLSPFDLSYLFLFSFLPNFRVYTGADLFACWLMDGKINFTRLLAGFDTSNKVEEACVEGRTKLNPFCLVDALWMKATCARAKAMLMCRLRKSLVDHWVPRRITLVGRDEPEKIWLLGRITCSCSWRRQQVQNTFMAAFHERDQGIQREKRMTWMMGGC